MSDDYELDNPAEPHVIVEDETLAAGFTQIPNQVLRRSDLQPGAKLTYMTRTRGLGDLRRGLRPRAAG